MSEAVKQVHEQVTGFLEQHTVDFVVWRADQELLQAGSDPNRKLEALEQVARLLAVIPEQIKQGYYVDLLKKKFSVNKRQFQEAIKRNTSNDAKGTSGDPLSGKMPAGVDPDEAYKAGFFEHDHCYHFITGTGIFEGSNFVIKPLFHIYSKTDNKRLIEIVNRYGRSRVIDVPTKSFVSVEQFQGIAAGEGNYLFYGNKAQFFKVLSKVLVNMPVCEELKTLGWQSEGFLAFANGSYSNGVYHDVNDMGMMEHAGKRYFSPAYSLVYKDVRKDDDEYEGDRFFIHQKSPVTFQQWAELMVRVYHQNDNGRLAVAFLIACCFRDLIYSRYKIFPHLFLFGEKQSGKSQLGWSLSNFFFSGMPPFNLNSGTFVGFSRKLARFRNTVSWFDEYSNEIEERRLQQLKSAYDGVGHEKGKMTTDNRTSITPVNAGCVISGQYLPTRDDNALFTRSILLNFEQQAFTREQLEVYNQLKDLESQGISSLICEVVQHRELMEKKYMMTLDQVYDEIKYHESLSGMHIEERLIRNFATILTSVKLLSTTNISLPFTYQQLLLQSTARIVEMSSMIHTSEALAVFWDIVIYLLDNHLIRDKYDFKLEVLHADQPMSVIKGYVKAKPVKESISFSYDMELLHLNLNKIHPLYLENHRKQYGNKGLDKNSLIYYLKGSKAYVGYANPVRFDNVNTSSFIFDHSLLQNSGVNFLRSAGGADFQDSVFQSNNDVPF
jgi:DNA primase